VKTARTGVQRGASEITRAGKPPLDVSAEIEREIADLNRI
jgi:hypothetical protein